MGREEQVVLFGRRLGYYHVERPPLVILHGLGAPWQRDDPFFEFLSRHFELYVIDLPGYGGSDPLNGVQDLALYAKTLERFCVEKKFEQIFLLGLSFGSLVATTFAASYPECCGKLILVGAPIFFPRTGILPSSFWKFAMKLVTYVPLSLLRFQIARTLLRWLVTGLMRIPVVYAARFFRPDGGAKDFFEGHYAPLAILRDDLRMIAEVELNQMLAKVKAPYLLVYGSKDMLLNQQVRRKYSDHLLVIEDATHCPHWAHPKELAEAVIEFLLK